MCTAVCSHSGIRVITTLSFLSATTTGSIVIPVYISIDIGIAIVIVIYIAVAFSISISIDL